MTTIRRYPFSYTILAGLAGVIAWGLPYAVAPFISRIPFMPDFPVYSAPPYQVPLARLAFCYALAGILAGGLFLFGIRFLPLNRNRYTRPSLSLATILSTIAALATAGVVAIVIGLLVGTSHTGFMLADSLGFGTGSVEPYLSIGWGLGTAIATIIFFSFSGLRKKLNSANGSNTKTMLKIALKVAGITLLIRLITCAIEFSSAVTYTIGDSIPIFIIFQAVSGLFFGIFTWIACSKIKTA